MLGTIRATSREIWFACRLTADLASRNRLCMDVVLYRLLKLRSLRIRTVNQERTIKLRNGAIITYRLNRGDIQTIREIWFDEVYRLPIEKQVDVVVDLGANIGLASLYLAKKHKVKKLVSVEPNVANATLVRRNLQQNGISAVVIEAAIGPADGVAHFSDADESNVGAVGETGREVRMVSMPTLLAEHSIDSIDVLKMDIEGGEQALLSGPIGWLGSVQVLIAEFHPDHVDYPGLTKRIEEHGFRYIRAGSVYEHTADTFVQETIQAVNNGAFAG